MHAVDASRTISCRDTHLAADLLDLVLHHADAHLAVAA
jgi:hypothetical protein